MVNLYLYYNYLVVTEHQLVVNLTVPAVVREGDSFFPRVTVSKRVNATFFVYISSRYGNAIDGTAEKNLDYSYAAQEVVLDITITTITTTSPVRILTDNILELNERFDIVVVFSASPMDIRDLLKYNNPAQTVTIIDTEGECTFISFYNFNSLMTCIIFYVMHTFKYQLLEICLRVVCGRACTPPKAVIRTLAKKFLDA